MADIGNDTGVWMAKLVGAASGAGISLVYLLPKNRREAATRFLAGMSVGLIFGAPTGLWLSARLGITGLLSGPEQMLAGSAAASLCAWWALGILERIAGRYGARTAHRP